MRLERGRPSAKSKGELTNFMDELVKRINKLEKRIERLEIKNSVEEIADDLYGGAMYLNEATGEIDIDDTY